MWDLTSLSESGDSYGIDWVKECAVGRKDGLFLTIHDKSVSRKHAILEPGYKDWKQTLLLKDLDSKYGTYVNEAQVGSDPVELKSGDKVTFGALRSDWRVTWRSFNVCSSYFTSRSDKKCLREIVTNLGGVIKLAWEDNTDYLAMPQLMMTVKAVCALVSCKPIVKIDFFERLLESRSKKTPEPDYREYLPPIGETWLKEDEINFFPDGRRRNLFKGMKFLFLSLEQRDKLRQPIQLAGGKDEFLITIPPEADLVSPATKVIDPGPQTTSGTSEVFNAVLAVLKKHSKRTIPDSDVGLAILHCSTETYCNPNVPTGGPVTKMNLLSQTQFSSSAIYGFNTQVSQPRYSLAAGSEPLFVTPAAPATQTKNATMEVEESSQVVQSPAIEKKRQRSIIPTVVEEQSPAKKIKIKNRTTNDYNSTNIDSYSARSLGNVSQCLAGETQPAPQSMCDGEEDPFAWPEEVTKEMEVDEKPLSSSHELLMSDITPGNQRQASGISNPPRLQPGSQVPSTGESSLRVTNGGMDGPTPSASCTPSKNGSSHEFARLIVKRSAPVPSSQRLMSGGPNFKKFKKVRSPTYVVDWENTIPKLKSTGQADSSDSEDDEEDEEDPFEYRDSKTIPKPF